MHRIINLHVNIQVDEDYDEHFDGVTDEAVASNVEVIVANHLTDAEISVAAAPMPLETIINFLRYSFKDIDYKYNDLTVGEKCFCTPEEFANLVKWVKANG